MGWAMGNPRYVRCRQLQVSVDGRNITTRF
jgi:hypothetical protein